MKKLAFTLILTAGLVYLTSCEKVVDSIVSISEVEEVQTNIEGTSLATATYEGTQVPLRPFAHVAQPAFRRVATTTFVLENRIESPSNSEGELLSASYVELNNFNDNNKTVAYVTYNLQGEDHSGALLVADLSNSKNPRILTEVIFDGIDLNVCELSEDGTYLWLGGSSFNRGAVIIPVLLKENGDIQNKNSYNLVTIDGVASVNGIIQADEWLMVTAGNDGGGTFALNYTKGYALEGNDKFSNAKFSSSNGRANGNKHVSLEGGESAKLHVYSIGVADEDVEPIIALGSIFHQNVGEYAEAGKATCYMEDDENICYISMGANGFVAVDVTRGVQVMHSTEELLTSGNTNGVTADDDFIYLANGADGVAFIRKPETSSKMTDVELAPSYIWDDDLDVASANFVIAKGDYVFVAKGANGGLSILKHN